MVAFMPLRQSVAGEHQLLWWGQQGNRAQQVPPELQANKVQRVRLEESVNRVCGVMLYSMAQARHPLR